MNRSRCSTFFPAILVAALVFVVSIANAETAQGVLAVQIRSQGLVCEKPQRATRDTKLSKPNYDVWVLECENATYRFGRSPDLPAKIEKLSDEGAADRKE